MAIAAYVFTGIHHFSATVTCAESIEEAAKNVGVPVEKCKDWLEPWLGGESYSYRIVEQGDKAEFGE